MRARRVSVVLVALALAACSLGEDSPALEGEVPAPDPTSSTTTTTEPTTTTAHLPCPPVERGNGDEVREYLGDVDGDGAPDTVQSFPMSGKVALLADLAAGGGAITQIPTSNDAPVELLGLEVIDPPGDGRDVLWVRVGAGASTTIVGLFHLDGCDLAPATFENGDPVELPIGGTVGTVTGAECGSHTDPEADLLVYEASHLADSRYEVITTEYRWADGVLTVSPAGTPTVSETDDPASFGTFHCGDLNL